MNASPAFENGQAQGIVNEVANRYPQQVIITREDTGETIYTSAAAPVWWVLFQMVTLPLCRSTPACAMWQELNGSKEIHEHEAPGNYR